MLVSDKVSAQAFVENYISSVVWWDETLPESTEEKPLYLCHG